MESFDLKKLIFGDLLDADELGKLVNVDLGIGGMTLIDFNSIIVDDLMLEEDLIKLKGDTDQHLPQPQRKMSEDRKSDKMSVDDDKRSQKMEDEVDNVEEDGIKSDKDSFQVDSAEESAHEDGKLTPISQVDAVQNIASDEDE